MIEEFASEDQDSKYRLVVRCFGLIVKSKTVSQSGSFFSSIINMASGPPTLKNEKRVIRLSQSEPFRPEGRPPSLLFNEVYESETIEDSFDICPSLIAEVSCPVDMDIKIRVNVHYSSNATSSKDIFLCGGTFSLRDLLQDASSTISITLQSEHTVGAKAVLELLRPLQVVLQNPHFQLFSAPSSAPNPLTQRYVFYNEDDCTVPVVDVEEYSWEPRLAMKVSMLFLENACAQTFASYRAWVERRALEEMRQGIFSSTESALSSGWNQLKIGVIGGRINCGDLDVSSPPPPPPPAVGSSTPQPSNVVFLSHYPLYIDGDPCSPLSNDIDNRDPSSASSGTKPRKLKQGSVLDSFSKGKKRVKMDDIPPCTFVEIYFEDRSQVFSQYVGKTNTEYFSYHPVFGSNVNAEFARKPNCDPVKGSRTKLLKTPREFNVLTVESASRYAAPAMPHPRTQMPLDRGASPSDLSSFLEGSTIGPDDCLSTTSVNGLSTTFSRYIPTVDAVVRFNMYLEDNNGSRSPILIASTSISLGDYRDSSKEWITLNPVTSSSFLAFESIELLVSIEVLRSAVTGGDALKPSSMAPSSMPYCVLIDRLGDGSRSASPPPALASASSKSCLPNFAESISKSYEWMWHVGFGGMDPLAGDASLAYRCEPSPAVDAAVRSEAHRAREVPLSADIASEAVVGADVGAGPSVSSAAYNPPAPRVFSEMLLPRVDYAYPLPWLDSHIESIHALFVELTGILGEAEEWVAAGHYFRPSAMKKEMKVQFFPTNLHFQIMTVRRHSEATAPSECIESITSGCMSPHGLGHKKGGLSILEEDLLKQKMRLDSLKERYKTMVARKGGHCLPPFGPEFDMLEDIGKQLQQFETSSLSIGKRRIFAVSQAIATAASAVMLKLNLVIDGHIDSFVADKWLQLGFLLVFEGLLSVSGKEKNMLEDTLTAVDALRQFHVKIMSCPDRADAANPQTTPASSDDDCSGSSFAIDPNKVDVGYAGREVRIYLPAVLIARLPSLYRSQIAEGGAILRLFPVLFTQGIDMNQTLAASFSLDSSSATQLQLQINLRSLKMLNEYCKLVQPISEAQVGAHLVSSSDASEQSVGGGARASTGRDPSQASHPLLRTLAGSIATADASAKNVDMLIEVERACLLLNGCRVTFCKSGKDRTGMAVTLDQSRQLGERYRLGSSTARILRDCNIFRLYGTRIGVSEKNIGKRVFSFNRLQVQFLPLLYRPPPQVCEQMMKKDNS